MNSRTKVENQLIQEIHTLPLEILQTMLHLAKSIKKITPTMESSVNVALNDFLKRYEENPINIDTEIFEEYRKTATDRDFKL